MMRSSFLVPAVALFVFASPARAQTTPGLSVTVTSMVTVDGISGLRTYSYTVRNDATSARPLESFYLEIQSRALVTNVQSPTGWTFGRFLDQPFVVWGATEGAPEVPETDPRFGSIAPSPFQVQPGQTLGGFSFQSAGAPTGIRFLAEGFAPSPPVGDVEDIPGGLLSLTERTFQGTTQGPAGATATCNGQGGDADGDGICDPVDNCVFVANVNQQDNGGAPTETDPTGATPDGIGDVCQCGDPSGDGRIGQADVDLLRSALVGLASVPAPLKCSIADGMRTSPGLPQGCDLVDLQAIQRAVLLPASGPFRFTSKTCSAAMMP